VDARVEYIYSPLKCYEREADFSASKLAAVRAKRRPLVPECQVDESNLDVKNVLDPLVPLETFALRGYFKRTAAMLLPLGCRRSRL
jgi:hypothetical protein